MARLLHVTSPLQHGADVLSLQRRLIALGYEPGPADSVYGPATAAAVRAFQVDAGIAADGVVGPITRTKLAEAHRRPARPPSPAGRKALVEGRRWLGTAESPPSSNLTPFGAWFGVNGVPWCAIFLSYCFEIGAGTTIAGGFHGAGCTAKGCAYVPTIEAWLRATGLWLGRITPKPGDIAVYNWDGGVPDHTGIVETVGAGGSFTAIEGNTAVGDDSDGGMVLRRERTIAQVDGFGRI